MTKETIRKAVRFGLKKQGVDRLDEVTKAVVDSIELALDMEADQEETPSPIDRARPEPIPLPPSIVPAPAKEVAEPATTGPSPTEEVFDVKTTRMVSVATERDLQDALEQRKAAGPVKILSLNPGVPKQIRWRPEKFIKFLMEKAPKAIALMPHGRDKEIIIERQEIGFLPSGTLQDNDMVRLAYKHPTAGSDLEVCHNFVVQQTPPDVNLNDVLDDIIDRAKHMYRPRPHTLTSTTPIRSGPMAMPTNEMVAGGEADSPQDQDRYDRAYRSGTTEQLREDILGVAKK